MTEYVRIPIREDEHKRLVALQTEWTGQINSYLTRPSLSDVIKKLLDERKAIDMNTQEHLAPEYKPTKKSIAAVRRWWKAGKNIWEISQLTGLSESEVTYIVRDYT